jgi:hypothetical protein
MAAGQYSPVLYKADSKKQQSSAISLSLSPAVISRCHSWIMLLLVYVGPRATHFTGYCCWFTKVCGACLRQHTLLSIVVGLCGVSGNTLYWVLLLGLCGTSGNTLYWVLLFGLRGPRATHITGYCCWFTRASGNTHYCVLLLAYVGPWATHFTGSDVGLQQWV